MADTDWTQGTERNWNETVANVNKQVRVNSTKVKNVLVGYIDNLKELVNINYWGELKEYTGIWIYLV